MDMDVIQQARDEIAAERRRALVDAEKDRIRKHVPFWRKVMGLFPFSVSVTRRKK
jgi:hypothetical protein